MHISAEFSVRKSPASSSRMGYGITIHEDGYVSVLGQNDAELSSTYLKLFSGDAENMLGRLYSTELQSALEFLESNSLSGYSGTLLNNRFIINNFNSNSSLVLGNMFSTTGSVSTGSFSNNTNNTMPLANGIVPSAPGNVLAGSFTNNSMSLANGNVWSATGSVLPDSFTSSSFVTGETFLTTGNVPPGSFTNITSPLVAGDVFFANGNVSLVSFTNYTMSPMAGELFFTTGNALAASSANLSYVSDAATVAQYLRFPVLLIEYEDSKKTILSLLYVESRQLQDRDLATVIRELSKILNSGRTEIVDTIMEGADPGKLSIEIMITLLRTTFTARDLLQGWRDFLSRAHIELGKRGRDPSKLLRGLNDYR